jgi:hypothetical protein
MKFSKLIAFITIALTGWMTTSCDDDIDINAPYEDIAVVYCLLDPDSSKQYIRINKLFQSEGNAEQDAKNRSLHEYGDELFGRLIEFDASGNEIQSFELQSEEIADKDSGLFYYPEQKIYSIEGALNDESTYRLEFTKPNGEEVSGQTALLRKGRTSLSGSQVLSWRFNGMPFIANGEANENVIFDVVSPVNGKSFELNLEFSYTEEYADNTSKEFKVNIPVGSYSFTDVRESESEESQLSVKYNGLRFYERVAREVAPITGTENPAIVRRVPKADSSMIVKLGFADNELDIYIEVSKPSTSLLEDKPPYTNLTNGIGIVASRTNDRSFFGLTADSYDELVNAENLGLTGGRGFCNPKAPAGTPDSCF